MRSKLVPTVLAGVAAFTSTVLISTAGAAAKSEKVLHSFNVSTRPGGSGPQGGLVFDAAGNLYGTTLYGGSGSGDNCLDGSIYGCGTAFELVRQAGGEWTEKLLRNFGNVGDGANPSAGMIIDATGNLYGTTYGGGASSNGCGTVFELSPGAEGEAWDEKILYTFCSQIGDGSEPSSGLVFDAGGNLYGTTGEGGTGQCSCGVVFELMPQADGTWTEKVLHNFGNSGDGTFPNGGLVFDAGGNLYGVTGSGGSSTCDFGCGMVFELSPTAGGTWTEKLLYLFESPDQDPDSPMIFDTAGNLYGTTMSGIFRLTPNANGTWTERDIVPPSCCYPYALTLDAAGKLYATDLATGGGSCCGDAFVLTPHADGSWTETLLRTFSGKDGDGAYPSSGLIFDTVGHLYGTTSQGGFFWQFNSGQPTGTVFELAP